MLELDEKFAENPNHDLSLARHLESFDRVFNKINDILNANKKIPLISKSREMSFKRLV